MGHGWSRQRHCKRLSQPPRCANHPPLSTSLRHQTLHSAPCSLHHIYLHTLSFPLLLLPSHGSSHLLHCCSSKSGAFFENLPHVLDLNVSLHGPIADKRTEPAASQHSRIVSVRRTIQFSGACDFSNTLAVSLFTTTVAATLKQVSPRSVGL